MLGALLGALCLLGPGLGLLLGDALAALTAAPTRYLLGGLLILGGMVGYAWFLDRRIDAAAVGWMLYLLAVSCWEEWVFRLALPYFGQELGFDLRVAVVLSNLLFGVLHYVTLRWKWPWCVAAFFGGMALSRQFAEHQDLAMIIAFHWVATYVNTPRLPGRSASAVTAG